MCCVVKLLLYFMYNPVSNFNSRHKVTFVLRINCSSHCMDKLILQNQRLNYLNKDKKDRVSLI